MPLPILKSTAKNFVVANSKIGSQVLCRCQSRNQQPQTLLLLIQKSAATNCVAIDSEISSENYATVDS
jgi:16S rRNA A1518/A1519 N6-dimethyltransferase RsmA/KsgA/DIM1 with predicted DNA glycosylase/AP lyase activity